MKRTYRSTLFYRPDNLEEARVTLYLDKGNRYEKGSRLYMADVEPEDERKVEFTGLKCWDIIEGGKEAEEIEAILGEVDENHEYLVLHLTDKTEIYRNSHVTMFIL